jgi:uncharacterized DUF497 family protein
MPRPQFEWNDAKDETNQASTGFHFGQRRSFFSTGMAIDLDATRHADSEIRRKVIGMIEGRLFAVVYTRRGDVYRLISARRANRKEERTWLDLR